MTSRSRHGLFLIGSAIALPALWFLILHLRHELSSPRIIAVLAGTAAAEFHGILGWLLWSRKFRSKDFGISSGIGILAIRFLAGAGCFYAGFVSSPGAPLVFSSAWIVCYIVLTASESAFFVLGVQEL